MGNLKGRLHPSLNFFTRVFHRFISQHGFFLGSALAFDLLIYSMPLFIIGISVISHISIKGSTIEPYFISLFQHWLPHSAIGVSEIFSSAENIGMKLSLVTIALLFFMTGGILSSVRIIMKQILETQFSYTGLWTKILDLLVMVLLSIMFGIVTILSFFMHSLEKVLQENFPLKPLLDPTFVFAGTALRFALSFFIFFLIFYVHGYKKFGKKAVMSGAVAAVVLFELSKYLLDIYVFLFSTESLYYGALGAFIFYFIWLYYSALSFVLSACIAWSIGTSGKGE